VLADAANDAGRQQVRLVRRIQRFRLEPKLPPAGGNAHVLRGCAKAKLQATGHQLVTTLDFLYTCGYG